MLFAIPHDKDMESSCPLHEKDQLMPKLARWGLPLAQFDSAACRIYLSVLPLLCSLTIHLRNSATLECKNFVSTHRTMLKDSLYQGSLDHAVVLGCCSFVLLWMGNSFTATEELVKEIGRKKPSFLSIFRSLLCRTYTFSFAEAHMLKLSWVWLRCPTTHGYMTMVIFIAILSFKAVFRV